MTDESQELLKGTLDMLILQALEREPMHGWGIADRIEVSSRGVFKLQTGTLYPSLHRLLRKGWIAAAWRTTENNRRARYYRLSPAGRKYLEAARASWERASGAINHVLDALS
jgi:PadR family transcriptional regulator, regulatory protein PadR